ncbi:hypothetical protein GCM10010394_69130 [Streptomyces crystallinus]|uniref:MmyB-like transcription regulator ligand binding domain-containing protein n=1 Tax=Streptomyces crystallinus TaxID=68191 RepID=A0ABN1H472_9ACTN
MVKEPLVNRSTGPVPENVRGTAATATDQWDAEARAYVDDHMAMMDATDLPSFLVDRGWNVVHANTAYDRLFGAVGPHPTAMPRDNFLRFVLFHPHAGAVLAQHETSWCLPMLARLSAALERDPHDPELRAVRREVADDPLMSAAYQQGLPHWMRAVGRAAVEHDGAVRAVRHPDPGWDAVECRVLEESSGALGELGLRRVTLVPRREPAAPRARESVSAPGNVVVTRRRGHLSVVRADPAPAGD